MLYNISRILEFIYFISFILIVIKLLYKLYSFISVRFQKVQTKRYISCPKKLKPRKEYKGINRKLDYWLIRRGHPFGLKVYSFIITNIVCLIILPFIVSIRITHLNIFSTVILAITGLVLFYIILWILNKNHNQKIEQDMPKVISKLYMQSCAMVPINECLKNLPDACINSKYLKDNLNELYVKCILHQLDISSVSDEIGERFDNIDFHKMIIALKNWKDTGDMLKILERLHTQMLDIEEEQLNLQCKSKLIIATLSTILIAISIINVATYAMVHDMLKGISAVFG